MSSSYKSRFYSKYVSTHNANLYGRNDLGRVRAQYSIWDHQYGGFLPEDRAARVADLGCGDGGLVSWLRAEGFKEAEGVDVSGEQIASGRAMGIEGLVEMDLKEYLHSRPNHFDLLFVRDVLGHFPKEEILEIVELIYAALKPGGMVVIKTPNAESPLTGRLRYGDFTHDTSFAGQSLRQLLEVYGFKDVEIFSMRPAVHGVISLMRWILWWPIEIQIRFWRLVEAGSPSGWFTQNVMAVGRK